jgi:hypothetical protein
MSNNLLIKLPSRERPKALRHALHLYSSLCADPARTRILVTVDDDDASCAHMSALFPPNNAVPIHIVRGKRSTKIGAVNRDLPWPAHSPAELGWHWDVLLVASDDQWPVEQGYDDVIRDDMAAHFPDTDGCLWYHDGHQERICTQSIVGRAYYNRLGRVYDPRYQSYRADDQFTLEAQRAGKLAKLPHCLIRHEHPFWRGAMPDDALYAHNRKAKERDKMEFERWLMENP